MAIRSPAHKPCVARVLDAARMTAMTLDDVRTLLDAPSAAVLTTTRKDGAALASPVWFRWAGRAFEVVQAAMRALRGGAISAERSVQANAVPGANAGVS
jgi:hypothetical protein